MLGASAACNYDFDEYRGLAPPLRDSGSVDQGGAAGAGRSDAGSGAAGRSGSAGTFGPDAAKGDAAGGAAGAAGTGRGGSGGSSGATDSGDAAGTDAAGGAGGTAGSSGSDGAADAGESDDGGATDGAGGSGGTPIDASVDGDSGGGAGGPGSGGTAGTGAGGTGTGGAGTGGTGGATPPPDGGSRPDLRVVDRSGETSSDATFDCAAIGGQVYENHCYYAMTTPVTWAVAARQACVAPAHLVTITSPGEQSFVVSFFTDESRWIGYYRPTGAPQNPSAFQWITGESSMFHHWYASNGEPDYDGECVRLGPSNNWGDNPCSAAFPVICERE